MPEPTTTPFHDAVRELEAGDRALCDTTAAMAESVLEPAFLAAAERLIAQAPSANPLVLQALAWRAVLRDPLVEKLLRSHFQIARSLEKQRCFFEDHSTALPAPTCP